MTEKLSYRKSVTDGMIDYFCAYETITAFEYLKVLQNHAKCSPMSKEKPHSEASNSEIRRWLEKGSVRINEKAVQPNDVLEFPIKQLIFFKGSKSQCTIF